MKENTQLSLFFESISGKHLSADFSGGTTTSDSGVLFLRTIAKHTGILHKLSSVVFDRRHQSYVAHDYREILSQRVYQIATGYEDANDSNELRHDPGFKCACDRLAMSDSSLASQPTMSRFENSISRTALYRMALVFIDNYLDSHRKIPHRIILDIDDTDDTVHGGQQLSLFNAYYDNYCFQPLHIYDGTSGKLITAILRPGKRPSGNETVAILRRVVDRIRARWKKTKIIIRGDSHFSTPQLHEYCDHEKLSYILGQKLHSTQKQPCIEPHILNKAYAVLGKDLRFYEEHSYRAGSWKRSRRMIKRIIVNGNGIDVRAIVTNLTWKSARRLYEKLYCARGTMENFIKNHKNVLQSDRTSCHRFEANQFRLFLHSAAYVLLHTLQQKALAGTVYATAQFDTIQKRILKIGARVVERSKRIHFHLPTSFPLKPLLFSMQENIAAAFG